MPEAEDRAELAKLRHQVEALIAINQAILDWHGAEACSPKGYMDGILDSAKTYAILAKASPAAQNEVTNIVGGIPPEYADHVTKGDADFVQMTPSLKAHALEIVLNGVMATLTSRTDRTEIADKIRNKYLNQGYYNEHDMAVDRLLELFVNA